VDPFARAWQFERDMQDRCASSLREFEYGTALYNDALRRVYDTNFVRFERGFEQLTGDIVEAHAEELQASLRHRKVTIADERAGARVAEELRERGWRHYTLVTMAYRGDGRFGARAAEEVTPEELRPVRERSLDDGRRDAEALQQIVAFTELMASTGQAQLIAARGDRDEIGSFCALFRGDGIAQIDEVGTLEQYRRRGLARAVVQGALQAARGADLIFLVADERDWPKDWYARLGFEPIGRRWELLRVHALSASARRV
jgi:ribosomal protein S18 acetylase RimI-like enzyme